MALRILPQSGFLVVMLTWFSGASLAPASEPVHLDPNAKPTSPPATIGAVITEETSDRWCSVNLIPNGVLALQRPCALDDRIGAVRRWTMDARSISLLQEDGKTVFRFHAIRPRVYRTEDEAPPQLVLSLLPQSSMPMSE